MKDCEVKMAKQQNPEYAEFNKIQSMFYTDRDSFEKLTHKQIRDNGFRIYNNLAKGYPHLALVMQNLVGINWAGSDNLEILRALQNPVYDKYKRLGLPNFVYFASKKAPAEKKERKSKKTADGLVFDDATKNDICCMMMIDSKTYEYLKFSDKIQNYGRQVLGEIERKKESKAKRK